MTSDTKQKVEKNDAVYKNPVFNSPFPDPYVLKFGGSYFAYCTGFDARNERVFPIATSSDLVNWKMSGAAMAPLGSAPPLYWAPEVTYWMGRFYLYYSCGNEVNMGIRVAVSDRPDGGFNDSGHWLTSEQFAIDPHVFIDDDGSHYLFYATDFLAHSHIGTGTVVDRMIDWFQLEGQAVPVTRAKFDWQVYDPQRAEKGNVRWHTVEGPTVFKRKKKYYEMFSGGNWKNETYGVAYAVSDEIQTSEEWDQPIDGETLLPILRSGENGVVGPGHNSMISGPNNREQYCVYHSWFDGERVMSIDRMDVVGDRLIVLGPTNSDQQCPFRSRRAAQADIRSGTVVFEQVAANFLLVSTLRVAGSIEIAVGDKAAGTGTTLTIERETAAVTVGTDTFPMSIGTFEEFRLLEVELNGPRLRIWVDGRGRAELCIPEPAGTVGIAITIADAEVLNLEVTEGFVDLFEELSDHGWEAIDADPMITAGSESMIVDPARSTPRAIVAKGSHFDAFEFAANIRALSTEDNAAVYGFAVLSEDDRIQCEFRVIAGTTAKLLVLSEDEAITFPEALNLAEYHQFRFLKDRGRLTIDLEGTMIADLPLPVESARMGIIAYTAAVEIEMARAIRTSC